MSTFNYIQFDTEPTPKKLSQYLAIQRTEQHPVNGRWLFPQNYTARHDWVSFWPALNQIGCGEWIPCTIEIGGQLGMCCFLHDIDWKNKWAMSGTIINLDLCAPEYGDLRKLCCERVKQFYLSLELGLKVYAAIKPGKWAERWNETEWCWYRCGVSPNGAINHDDSRSDLIWYAMRAQDMDECGAYARSLGLQFVRD